MDFNVLFIYSTGIDESEDWMIMHRFISYSTNDSLKVLSTLSISEDPLYTKRKWSIVEQSAEI